jgi:prepilin-type N-terminal cleavage/methylation domain-containing protein
MHRLTHRRPDAAAHDGRAREAGFTLIELLVVITILGVLAAVVIFAVNGIRDRGNSAAKAADTATLRTAEEAYCAKNDPHEYATEAELKAAGFLASESSLHDIGLGSDEHCGTGAKSSYVISLTTPEVDGDAIPGIAVSGAGLITTDETTDTTYVLNNGGPLTAIDGKTAATSTVSLADFPANPSLLAVDGSHLFVAGSGTAPAGSPCTCNSVAVYNPDKTFNRLINLEAVLPLNRGIGSMMMDAVNHKLYLVPSTNSTPNSLSLVVLDTASLGSEPAVIPMPGAWGFTAFGSPSFGSSVLVGATPTTTANFRGATLDPATNRMYIPFIQNIGASFPGAVPPSTTSGGRKQVGILVVNGTTSSLYGTIVFPGGSRTQVDSAPNGAAAASAIDGIVISNNPHRLVVVGRKWNSSQATGERWWVLDPAGVTPGGTSFPIATGTNCGPSASSLCVHLGVGAPAGGSGSSDATDAATWAINQSTKYVYGLYPSANTRLKVYDYQANTLVTTVTLPSSGPAADAFVDQPSGKILVPKSDGSVAVIDGNSPSHGIATTLAAPRGFDGGASAFSFNRKTRKLYMLGTTSVGVIQL